MKIKKNVYIVLTEYQFLQSVNLATSIYGSSNFINNIYIVRNGRRLSGIDSNEDWTLDNGLVHILDDKSLREIADIIIKEEPDHFFIFQGNSPLNVYLASFLANKGAEISLGPDGYGAYNIFNKKYPLLTLMKDSIKANYFLMKNNLFNGKFYRFDYYKYANHNFIDNVWLPHSDQYIHRSKNKVKLLNLPDFNEKCIDFVRKCFGFNNTSFNNTKNAIYYFNQPLWDELIDVEFEFLNSVLNNFPDKEMIVKLHPLTTSEMKIKYSSLDRITIIDSLVPAEVILINLKNCIVFSGWSSVLMMNNKRCNYYFNYPIYKNSKVKMLNQSDLIVLDHIKLISSPKEMEFPNGQTK